MLGSLKGRRSLLVVPYHLKTCAIGDVEPGGSFPPWI